MDCNHLIKHYIKLLNGLKVHSALDIHTRGNLLGRLQALDRLPEEFEEAEAIKLLNDICKFIVDFSKKHLREHKNIK